MIPLLVAEVVADPWLEASMAWSVLGLLTGFVLGRSYERHWRKTHGHHS